MANIFNRFNNYLLTNNSWIYVGLILIAAASCANIYAPDSWALFTKVLIRLLLTFTPVLLFVHFQKKIQSKLTLTVYIILWSIIFVAYPLLIKSYLQNQPDFLGVTNIGAQYFFSIALIIFITELVLIANKYLSKTIYKSSQWNKLNIKKSIGLSLLFLSLFLSFLILPNRAAAQNSLLTTVFLLLTNSLQILLLLFAIGIFIWINYIFLVPVLFKARGFLIYLFGSAICVVLLFPILSQVINWLPLFDQRPGLLYEDGSQIFADINAFVPFIAILGSLPIILAIQWQQQFQTIQQLQQENTEAELNLLKQQINPHFFFNTLNNLYSLALEKSNKCAEAILKLSELMRYVIYKGKEKMVPLQAEINYLQDYISLQQLRFHQNIEVSFDIDLNQVNYSIAPLLLTEPIENAFKHGIASSSDESFLKIAIKTTNDKLAFQCINSFEFSENEKKGIGLNNLKRRLALLYPNAHQLNISISKNIFTFDLEIWKN